VPLHLSPSAQRAFAKLTADLVKVFDRRLVSIVATGQASSVAFVSEVTGGDLDALGALAETWRRDGLDVPLVLTVHEFERSLDVFPVEYQALADRHVVITGTPPFEDLVIEREHLRRACETAAKGYLLQVRQGWIAAAGHREALLALLVSSAQPLRTVLTHVARLEGATGDDDRASAGARTARLDVGLVEDVLALDASPGRAEQMLTRLPDYLSMATALWAFVDEWKR
jgi:hypothetical protein